MEDLSPSTPEMPVDLSALREATDHDEAGMRQLVRSYLDECAKDVITLKRLIASGNAKEVQRVALGGAGAAAAYGMAILIKPLRQLESMGKENTLDHATESLAQVEKCLSAIHQFWAAYLQSPTQENAA